MYYTLDKLHCAIKNFLVLVIIYSLPSCGWQEAKEMIAVADSLDRAEHVIYDDTEAIAGVIRK